MEIIEEIVMTILSCLFFLSIITLIIMGIKHLLIKAKIIKVDEGKKNNDKKIIKLALLFIVIPILLLIGLYLIISVFGI